MRGTAFAMIALMATMLVWRGTGANEAFAVLRWGSWSALGALYLFALPRMGLREAYLSLLCVAVTLAALFASPQPARAFAAGLDQAAFLAAFILLLTQLFETALTSPAVRACGAWLARLPGGLRHAGLFWGTNGMAVLFNLGIVTLLSPLVRAGLPAADDGAGLRDEMERRQLSAVLRGFAWGVIWSPTAIAPLALFELIDGIDRLRWTLLGLVLALLIFALSWAQDALRARDHPEWDRHAAPGRAPLRAWARFALCALALLALALAGQALTGQGLVFGLMLACPVMMIGWLALQNDGRPRPALAGARTIVFTRLPTIAAVAVTLAASGYLGRVGAALLPMDQVEALVDAIGWPQWVWLTVTPCAIMVLSFLAVSPIMFAVFFGSLFGALPQPPVEPTLLALSISCGWALAMTASPFATVALLMARQNELAPARLTVRWNGPFTLASIVLMAAFFHVLTGGA